MGLLKLAKLGVIGYPYLALASAMYQRMRQVENRKEIVKHITTAIEGDKYITVAEWARIGKSLGVFRTKQWGNKYDPKA